MAAFAAGDGELFEKGPLVRKIEIINSLLSAIGNDVAAVLAIVVETVGSAPREPGAWMAVFADGRVEGTVGGGMLECRAIEDARALLQSGESRLVRYTIGGAKSDTGMVCGGAAGLLLISVMEQQRLACEQMAEMLCERGTGVCSIDLAPFGGPLPQGEHGEDRARATQEPISWTVETAHGEDLPRPGVHGSRYLEPICPEDRAVILGCGHVGRALAEVLTFAGLEVVACDDRPEMLDAARFPRAVDRRQVDYANLAESVSICERDFVVVCTAGHASDFEVLAQALPVRPRYVGCLGSKKKTVHVKARLQEAGLPSAAIEAIHMPVGVPIACETPEEIAISIAAQVVDERRS